MGEAKTGQEFIKHEFDEAIAIQQCIVEAEETLATRHPMRSAKTAIKSSLADDRGFLEQLTALGKTHDATGEVEDVAGGLKELMDSTLETATASVGASGGISGLLAYYALRFPNTRLGLFLRIGWIQLPAWGAFALWVLLQIFVAFQQVSGVGKVSGLAHLGGAFLGFLFWLKER